MTVGPQRLHVYNPKGRYAIGVIRDCCRAAIVTGMATGFRQCNRDATKEIDGVQLCSQHFRAAMEAPCEGCRRYRTGPHFAGSTGSRLCASHQTDHST